MDCVFPVKLAEFLDFQPAGSVLLLLGAGVISAFALSAFQNNDFAHFTSPCLPNPGKAVKMLPAETTGSIGSFNR